MRDPAEIETELYESAEDRFNNFRIKDIESISSIEEDSYLESPVWVGGDTEFACLFIDLDKSSKRSFKSNPETMAKIYDYFTQTIHDVLDEDGISADYID